jgi:hypothetical protein
MSKETEKHSQIDKEIAAADAELQQMYEQRGGKGNVVDFLVKGATPFRLDKDNNWDIMSPEEQQLWLDLHDTELPLLGLSLMSGASAEND